MTQPTTRDVLDLAARFVAERDKVSPRQAKATVHHMAWPELLEIVDLRACQMCGTCVIAPGADPDRLTGVPAVANTELLSRRPFGVGGFFASVV